MNADLRFLHDTVSDACGRRVGRDGVWQLAPVQSSLPWERGCIERLEAFQERLRTSLPRLHEFGRQRALRAYGNHPDTITKPSYRRRLDTEYAGQAGNQIDTIVERFSSEPESGGLVFSVFHPADLTLRRRPGYVPCLVAGSILLHDGEIQLNIFFRSQSIVEFGVMDLIFLRQLQAGLVLRLDEIPRERFPVRRRMQRLRPGLLNLHFARVIIQDRLARNRQGYLRRAETVESWLDLLGEAIDS